MSRNLFGLLVKFLSKFIPTSTKQVQEEIDSVKKINKTPLECISVFEELGDLTNKYRNVMYTGVTNDLIRRVYEHRNHLIKDSFTARYHIYKLVYFEMTEDIRSAIEREKQIKSWSRKKKNKPVHNPGLIR